MWAVAGVVAVALLGAACTSDADRGKAEVEAATLRIEDLPPGWVASPPDTAVENEGDASRFAQCVGRPEPKTVRTATEVSPQFHVEERSRASSTVQTVRNLDIVRDDFAALDGDRAVGCLRQRLRAQLDRQSTPGSAPRDVTVARLPGLAAGEGTVSFRATITYPTSTAYLDLVNVRMGKLEMSVAFFNQGEPFSADVERSVLTRMVDRAGK